MLDATLYLLLQSFLSPTPTLMAFSGVTNAHGPNSMQVCIMQSDECNTTSTKLQMAKSKILIIYAKIDIKEMKKRP